MPSPSRCSDYSLGWDLRRLDSNVHAVSLLQRIAGRYDAVPTQFSKAHQWALTTVGGIIAGFPFTPVSDGIDHVLMTLLVTDPAAACGIIAAYFGVSVITVRFLFFKVLSSRRFKEP